MGKKVRAPVAAICDRRSMGDGHGPRRQPGFTLIESLWWSRSSHCSRAVAARVAVGEGTGKTSRMHIEPAPVDIGDQRYADDNGGWLPAGYATC